MNIKSEIESIIDKKILVNFLPAIPLPKYKKYVEGLITMKKETASAILAEFSKMLPKEIEIPTNVCGVKVTIAEAYGHNSCLKIIKSKLAEERSKNK